MLPSQLLKNFSLNEIDNFFALLRSRSLCAKEVANLLVEYSRFAVAFKQQFGITPS
ncbi:hypothetical protein [Chlorogloeopsis sp. ULAP02]|uniref:hypothetical protein n=1 Tax=Chlorogloeopsis sp. ULAP02 TaxID=3107926 RepID=UPI0031359C7B